MRIPTPYDTMGVTHVLPPVGTLFPRGRTALEPSFSPEMAEEALRWETTKLPTTPPKRDVATLPKLDQTFTSAPTSLSPAFSKQTSGNLLPASAAPAASTTMPAFHPSSGAPFQPLSTRSVLERSAVRPLSTTATPERNAADRRALRRPFPYERPENRGVKRPLLAGIPSISYPVINNSQQTACRTIAVPVPSLPSPSLPHPANPSPVIPSDIALAYGYAMPHAFFGERRAQAPLLSTANGRLYYVDVEPGHSEEQAVEGVKVGRWTEEEKEIFLHGMRLYGFDYKKIAKLITTRTITQVRTHAQKVFAKYRGPQPSKKSAASTPSSPSDDQSSVSSPAPSINDSVSSPQPDSYVREVEVKTVPMGVDAPADISVSTASPPPRCDGLSKLLIASQLN